MVANCDGGIGKVPMPPFNSLQGLLVFSGGRVGLMVGVSPPPPVCIHDVSDEDSAISLVLVTDTLTVLPIPGQVGRAVKVPNDKNSTHLEEYFRTSDQNKDIQRKAPLALG